MALCYGVSQVILFFLHLMNPECYGRHNINIYSIYHLNWKIIHRNKLVA